MNFKELESSLLNIVKRAGNEIMHIYQKQGSELQIDYKKDNSPLTMADTLSNDVILTGLKSISEFPIISEESRSVPYLERKKWDIFWLVDPLDGTKEFISRNGQFTVNIALIDNGIPAFGIIYVPAQDIAYIGYGHSAWKIDQNKRNLIRVNNKSGNRIAVRSRSHSSNDEEEVLEKFGVSGSISVGSSLKFCMVAEGKADIYYRHGPTMEWDIAAGHAIARAAGGEVFAGQDTEIIFSYNKEDLKNGSFLCIGFSK